MIAALPRPRSPARRRMVEIVTLQRAPTRKTFVWLSPLWFVVGVLLAVQWHGHGWQLFSIGALPGVWATFLLGAEVPGSGTSGANGTVLGWVLPSLLCGAAVMWLLGTLLDRLETDARLWLGALVLGAAVAGYVLLQGYNDLDGAIDHHGSFFAFVVCALQLGSYGATLLLLAIGAGRGGAGAR